MVGIGFDIHRLVKGRLLLLGGVRIKYPRGLLGHSDGDVLLHAICDALLGAAGLGDIGDYFPDTDPRLSFTGWWLPKGSDSTIFVRDALKRITRKGYKISHLDTIIFAEAPKLYRLKDKIRQRVAGLLKVAIKQVNIKAKTFEGLGVVGKKQAIAALVVVMLNK